MLSSSWPSSSCKARCWPQVSRRPKVRQGPKAQVARDREIPRVILLSIPPRRSRSSWKSRRPLITRARFAISMSPREESAVRVMGERQGPEERRALRQHLRPRGRRGRVAAKVLDKGIQQFSPSRRRRHTTVQETRARRPDRSSTAFCPTSWKQGRARGNTASKA